MKNLQHGVYMHPKRKEPSSRTRSNKENDDSFLPSISIQRRSLLLLLRLLPTISCMIPQLLLLLLLPPLLWKASPCDALLLVPNHLPFVNTLTAAGNNVSGWSGQRRRRRRRPTCHTTRMMMMIPYRMTASGKSMFRTIISVVVDVVGVVCVCILV